MNVVKVIPLLRASAPGSENEIHNKQNKKIQFLFLLRALKNTAK